MANRIHSEISILQDINIIEGNFAKCKKLDSLKDSTHLKVEMKAIKEQFLSLLKNFDVYQNSEVENDTKVTETGKALLCGGLSTRARARTIIDSRSQSTDVNEKLQSSIEDLPVSQKPYAPHFTKVSRKRNACNCKTSRHHCSKSLTTIDEDKENIDTRKKRHMMHLRKTRRSGDLLTELNKAPLAQLQVHQNVPLKSQGDQTSVWDSVDNKTAVLSSDDYTLSPKKITNRILDGLSPMRPQNTKAVNKTKNIKDISGITDVSQVSVREQNSAIGLDLQTQGPLHSTVCYPLHSTMNKTQMSHFGLNQSLENLSGIEPQSSDNSGSSDTVALRKSAKLGTMRQLKVPSHVRNPIRVVPHYDCVGPLSTHSPPNMRPDDTLSVGSPVEEDFPDTDCDSSYLSDYGDMYSQYCGAPNEYKPTNDEHHGSMRMMKRQTGRIDLEKTKTADDQYGHLSMVGRRGSLPDLTVIEPVPAAKSSRSSKKRPLDSSESSSKKLGDSKCSKKSRVLAPLNPLNVTSPISTRPASNDFNNIVFSKLPKREDPQGMAASPSQSSLFSRPHPILKSSKARYSTGFESSYSTINSTRSSLTGRRVKIADSVSHHLPDDHKRKLARKMRRFSKNFQRIEDLGNVSNIKTLAHV